MDGALKARAREKTSVARAARASAERPSSTRRRSAGVVAEASAG